MDCIHDIYRMLSCESTQETRSIGIRLANELKDLSLLIMPSAPPSVWELCAQILCKKNDESLQPYLCNLLEWLQDLNWPGALTILDRLKKFSGKKLKKPFIMCYNAANNLDNAEGLRWLDYLSELLDNEELKTNLPKHITKKLQKHYKNWGFWLQ